MLVQVHGGVGEPWWLWVEDPLNDHIYHSEYFLLQKKQVCGPPPGADAPHTWMVTEVCPPPRPRWSQEKP